LFLVALAIPGRAQFHDPGIGGGVGFGGTFGQTQLEDQEARFLARAFVRYSLIHHLQGETGIALGRVSGQDYTTLVFPIDYRFVFSPFTFDRWNLYLYGGAGVFHYDVEQLPPQVTVPMEQKGWAGFIPAGIGIQIALEDQIILETTGGYNHALNDKLNAVVTDKNDAFWTYTLGLTVAGRSGDSDPDGDGLTNREEKELGTNPKSPDSDGDGLTDGSEVRQHTTNPLREDSDGDGLKDGEEITRHGTDPMKADSDGDGLKDGDEVLQHRTDPLKADTDADGLNDGDEVVKYHTDVFKLDTDGDGLSDGDEVTKHRTDPLKRDTDGGTVDDGVEVARGSDPLAPSDDVPPKKEELKIEVGRAIVLDGIVFATGKREITPASESVLEIAFNTLAQNPDITVEIQGHTDNTGSRGTNTRLSQARADAVKAWLVKKGIAADRMTTRGYGPDKPIADNTTREGRQKNRRIEFFRTK
jgi:outer membrane protein OmpA-like peptidoglycan-associated protein